MLLSVQTYFFKFLKYAYCIKTEWNYRGKWFHNKTYVHSLLWEVQIIQNLTRKPNHPSNATALDLQSLWAWGSWQGKSEYFHSFSSLEKEKPVKTVFSNPAQKAQRLEGGAGKVECAGQGNRGIEQPGT